MLGSAIKMKGEFSSVEILKNYSSVLVNFALNSGKGVRSGEVVYLQFDLPAIPLAREVYKEILKNGANPILKIAEQSFSKIFFEQASPEQLRFFPKKYTKSLVDTIDHRIYLLAPEDPFYLKNVNPEKLMIANENNKLYRKWLQQKEDKGKLTWTLALYPTRGMAKEALLTVKEFAAQIEKACFLKEAEPLLKWQQVFEEIEKIRTTLNKLPIKNLNIKAKNTNLNIGLGEKRNWVGGSGRNIPSFEIFTSPDWRNVNGYIYFDFPLYRYGNIIKDIYLSFKNGRVQEIKAAKNQKLLEELVKQKNANKLGEFSLTDTRFSKIDKFMANTLYDENFGGKYGNTHVALGSSYHDAYDGDASDVSKAVWKELGFNDSVEHTDIIAITDRVVEAELKDGSKKVIYKKGRFVF